MYAASGVRRRRRKRSLATLHPAPVCFPEARTIPVLRFDQDTSSEAYEIEFCIRPSLFSDLVL